jgi:CheY-like chemotaxis protein
MQPAGPILEYQIGMNGQTMSEQLSQPTSARTGKATETVMVVNGTPDVFELVESLLDAGRYDLVFVADLNDAYSQVKRSRPDLVVVCLGFDDPAGFQALSMLKLDADTRNIPLLTCADPYGRPDDSREAAFEEPGTPLPLAAHPLRMN